MKRFLKCLVLLIFICNQIIISKCENCELSVPGCLNTSHVLCKSKNSNVTSYNISNAILVPLNKFRRDSADSKFICNLNNFTWNTDFEKITNKLFYKAPGLCTMTNYSKNIVVVRETINISGGTESSINTFVSQHISKHPNYLSWAASAYSTHIGCSLFPLTNRNGRIVCITNGILLNNYEQSYGYNQECNIDQLKFQNKTCNKMLSTCQDHFICEKHDNFVNIRPLSIQFSTIRYILYKFEQERQNVTWNYDLQYFAERIVVQNLTDFDKCIAQDQYKEIRSLHFKGVQYFSEQISNIDNIWKRQEAGGQIGCAIFNLTINEITYIHVYCLCSDEATYVNVNPIQNTSITINSEVADISLDMYEISSWALYTVLILIFIDICEIVILFCLKCYIINVLQIIEVVEKDKPTHVYEEIVHND